MRFKIQYKGMTEIKKMEKVSDAETWNKSVQLAVQANTTYEQYTHMIRSKTLWKQNFGSSLPTDSFQKS